MLKNIKSSFEASGAFYDISNSLFPIIHYSKDFATRLSCNNYNKQQKKDLKVKREGYKEKKINIEELWENSPTKTSPKITKISQGIPSIVKNDFETLHSRLLSAFVPLDGSVKNDDIDIEQKKGRPKKDERLEEFLKENQEIIKQYQMISFEDKLIIELANIGINVPNMANTD